MDKWEVLPHDSNDYYSVQNGYLEMTSAKSYDNGMTIQSIKTIDKTKDVIAETKAYTLYDGDWDFYPFLLQNRKNSSNHLLLLEHDWVDLNEFVFRNSSSSTKLDSFAYGSWKNYALTYKSSEGKTYIKRDSSEWGWYNGTIDDDYNIGLNGRGYTGRWDYIRVRKYATIEPTVKIENVSESWLMLSTDKKNYSLGENIVLSIVVNYTRNPVFVQFKLELQEPYGAIPDTLIKTGFIPLTAGLYKKVSLNYPIPVSPLISEGDYTFKMYAIDGLGNIIASNATSFYINDSMPSSLVREFI